MSWRWILVLLLGTTATGERAKRFVAFRKGSSFFYRLNYKVSTLPHTTIFAHASGFKVGWQLPGPAGAGYARGSGLVKPSDLRDAASLLYDSHGLDGQMCLMKSLCQTMQLLSRQDGVLAKVLSLMAGANDHGNATSLLNPLECGNYANRCPLHLLGFAALDEPH